MTDMRSAGKSIYKIINTITTILIVLIVLFAALLVVPKAAGIDAYVVLSGSMEPAHRTGSLIYVKKNYDTDQLAVGDVITFRLSGSTVATHRIVDIEEGDARMFQTKGDANPSPDQRLVAEQDVIGKSLFSIPFLGYAADFVQHPPGIYFTVAFGIILLLVSYVSDRLVGNVRNKK